MYSELFTYNPENLDYDLISLNSRSFLNYEIEREVTTGENSNNNIPIITENEENKLWEINSIKNILIKYIDDSELKELKNKLNEENNLKNLNPYKFICAKVKQKSKEIKNSNCTTFNLFSKKRGRTKKDIGNSRIHGNSSLDNILIKLKANLFNKYLLEFLNKILKSTGSKLLVKLDYKKYINKIQKQEELRFLNMKLKDLFSLNNTKKNSGLGDTYNKSIISTYINKDNTVNFVLNLTYNDYIDLFTHKKTIKEISLFEIRKIDYNLIEGSLIGVEKFFADLIKKNKIEYSLLVVFCLFNLEKSIKSMQNRKRKSNSFMD